jgi:hypothetical protein
VWLLGESVWDCGSDVERKDCRRDDSACCTGASGQCGLTCLSLDSSKCRRHMVLKRLCLRLLNSRRSALKKLKQTNSALRFL